MNKNTLVEHRVLKEDSTAVLAKSEVSVGIVTLKLLKEEKIWTKG